MSKILQRLERQAFRAGITPRTKESREWFLKKAQNMRSINRTALMQEEELKQGAKQIIGSMQMFMYDPKHKDKLPYYDIFPLVIVLGPAKGGFMGLNLHYLPPKLRMQFFANLMDIQGSKLTEDAKFSLTYRMLKKSSGLRYFKPCLKHYLNSQVTSKFAEVLAPEWEVAIFLPTAQFRKANSYKVHYDSRSQIQ
jgi:hypothetical protein|tara:strand:- start:120 stop:704 length:585 start_codon:yes stop_codon:yes gene_type:complete